MKKYYRIIAIVLFAGLNGLNAQEVSFSEIMSNYENNKSLENNSLEPEFSFSSEEEIPCEDCIRSFAPSPGKYIVSAWVMEEGAPIATTSYINSNLKINFYGDATEFEFLPSGQIIDGWQRIEGIVTIPSAATYIRIIMQSETGTTTYFDDIRFFPLDGSMMSYVYDPESLRLMAELDERNYATLYEYDEEGKLVRVKKETERGVMTIQENRDNIKKL